MFTFMVCWKDLEAFLMKSEVMKGISRFGWRKMARRENREEKEEEGGNRGEMQSRTSNPPTNPPFSSSVSPLNLTSTLTSSHKGEDGER